MSAVATPDDVLTFWFGHADPTSAPSVDTSRWWMSTPAFDADIAARFGATMEAARDGTLGHWLEAPTTALALVIVCDQFPRNVHRGTSDAFAWDARARDIARHIESKGWADAWDISAASFALMPFEHSEDRTDQAHSVAAFQRLADRQPAAKRASAQNLVGYAIKHKAIIDRFGRFPHRNDAMGRETTAEESAWLNGGGDRFGQ